MERPLVEINYATLDDLEKLHGIKGKKAQKIIDYRKKKFIESVEDLIEAAEISQSLALTLEPHINFNRIITTETQEKKIRVIAFLIVATSTVFFLLSYTKSFYSIFIEQKVYDPVIFFVFFTVFLRFITIDIIFFSSWLSGLISNEKNINTLFNFTVKATTSLLVILSLSILSCLCVIVYLIALSDQGSSAAELVLLSGLLAELLILCGAILIFLPIILRIKYPNFISKKWLIRLSNIGVFIGLFILTVRLFLIDELNFEFLFISFCIVGLSFTVIDSILKEQPIIDKIQNLLFEKRIGRSDINEKDWKKWINTRLPDEAEQKELKQALSKKFPMSKSKSLLLKTLYLLPWLFITVLEGNIQEKTKNLYDNLSLLVHNILSR